MFIVGSLKEGGDQVVKFLECHAKKFIFLLVIGIIPGISNVKGDQIFRSCIFVLILGT